MENLMKQKAEELIDNANRKAEQLAEEAKRKADRLKEEAHARVQRLLARADEKITETKEGVRKAGQSSLEKVFKAGIGIMAGVVGFKLLVSEYSTFSQGEEVTAALNAAISNEISKGKKLSYSQADFNRFASMIQEATNGIGTDTSVIFEVFDKLNNNTDVLQLMKTYGKRTNTFFMLPLGRYTLTQLLISELSAGDRKKINEMFAKKGITLTV